MIELYSVKTWLCKLIVHWVILLPQIARGQDPSAPLIAGNWTWLSGSNQAKQSGVYGQPEIYSPLNVPGARQLHSAAIDPASRAMYLFGGFGHPASGAPGNKSVNRI